MIKALLIIGILTTSVCIGVVINNYFSMRVKIYKSIISIIQSIKSEIQFLKTNKISLLKSQNVDNVCVKEFVNSYVELGAGEILYLRPNENVEINKLFDSIGKSDIDGELNNLKYYEELILRNCKESENKFMKYGSFSIKMAILIGTLISIILL
jgi:hypothetical protein